MRRGAQAAHRQGPRPGVEAPDRARRRARLRGIDDDDVVGSRPGLHERGRVALQLAHLDARGLELAHPAGNGEAGAVVAAPGVAHADEDHPRSISRRRKCVAQEMQGS
jgi:hypothetical protein